MLEQTSKRWQSSDGFSLVELLIVVALTAVLTAIAIPQMVAQRRLMRSTAVTREIMTQLRYARQLAMSQSGADPINPQRVAFTFQYDDATKEIRIIGPIPSGTAALIDAAYPNNTGSAVTTRVPLTQGGLPSSEINYGIPTPATGLPAGAPTPPTVLGDGISRTNLSGGQLNITFQPDGSVINPAGNPVDGAMLIFNSKAAQATLSAISVVGASGRVKVWRYSINGNKYAE